MKYLFEITNEFSELLAQSIIKYENLNVDSVLFICNDRKYKFNYSFLPKENYFIVGNNTLSNPTLRNIKNKIGNSIKLINELVGDDKYKLYVPFLAEKNKSLILKNCVEVNLYEEGLEAINPYLNSDKNQYYWLEKYKAKHMLKAFFYTKDFQVLNSLRYKEPCVSNVYKFSNLAYNKLNGVKKISVKNHFLNSLEEVIVSFPDRTSQIQYIIVTSELFQYFDDNQIDGVVFEQVVAELKTLLEQNVRLYFKGRIKDKKDYFKIAQSYLENLEQFPPEKDLLCDLLLGKVNKVYGVRSSLLFYALQFKIEVNWVPLKSSYCIKHLTETWEYIAKSDGH